MAESKIRVEPNSIRKYGVQAQHRFEGVRADLVALVHDAATVHYFGPNAVQFKTEAARLATEFSARLLKDLGVIAEAVRTSTSNIAGSLGGQPISIQVNGSAVPVPAIAKGDGAVDVDLTALQGLTPAVKARFAKIEAGLSGHLADLRGTDWTGQAKTNAVDAVSSFTRSAVKTSVEAEKSITDYIAKQIAATQHADR